MMQPWQIVSPKGLKLGDFQVIGRGNRTGKSMFMANAYLSAWNKWEPVWSWKRRKSISGKMIWGRIAQRQHQLGLVKHGKEPWTQYATTKEAFVENLKNG